MLTKLRLIPISITTALLLSASIVASVNLVNTDAQSSSPLQSELKVFAIGVNYTIHELQLKATQMSNGQIIPVSTFVITPESVVQINQGQNLMVFTSTNEPQRIEQVKVTDVNNVVTDLVASPLPQQGYSIQGFVPGVYTLDVIVNGDNDGSKQAYETILVILAPNQQPIPPAEVTKIIQTQRVDVSISFGNGNKDNKTGNDNEDLRRICALNPADERCPKGPDCPPGWGNNEGDQCFPLGECPKGYHRANDDETGRCVPEKDLKQCANGSWAHKDDICEEDEEPICPPGEAGFICREDQLGNEAVEEEAADEGEAEEDINPEFDGDENDTPEPEPESEGSEEDDEEEDSEENEPQFG